MVRVAVLDQERCKPEDCGRICYKYCPQVKSSIETIKFAKKDGGEKAVIVEKLCLGCGICVKKCPFDAISIVKLPDELETDCSHRFGENTFKLYRLPVPQLGVVTGIIGKNGIGKTSALKILAGEIKPNLGKYDAPPDWDYIIRYFRGSVLQAYFEKFSRGEAKAVYKLQYVDEIARHVSGRVGKLLEKADERNKLREIASQLQIDNILDRDIKILSGGELQRVAIAAALCRDADIYLFDEPSSYLDVKQRLRASIAIRELISDRKIVIVAEHDLSVLDYLSDQICLIYGEPGVYGIISHPHGVRDGINIYLQGYIPDENMRFRKQAIEFNVKPPTYRWDSAEIALTWGKLKKSFEGFDLTVEEGSIHKGEVIGILGPNGIGKTTLVKLLAGIEKTDEGEISFDGTISYKPQYISATYEGTVASLLESIAKEKFSSSRYDEMIIQPLGIRKMLEKNVNILSGGELQRVAIALCLSRDSEVYLLDEPSAYLDVEERFSAASIIRRIIKDQGTTALVVEHDVAAQSFIADKLMIFSGLPSVEGHATTPMSLRDGMNAFLKEVDVTFRRDAATGRPRVNKPGSRLDKHQKEIGEYYYERDQ
jgi:ATP-binding cassette subfamily E protein 1